MPNKSPTISGTLFFNVLNVNLSISKLDIILLIAFETLSVIPNLSAKTIFLGLGFVLTSVVTSSAAISTRSVTS